MADEQDKTETTEVLHDMTDGSGSRPSEVPLGDVSTKKPSVGDGAAALDNLLIASGGDPANPDDAPTKTPEEVEAEKQKAADEKKITDDAKVAAGKKKADDAAGKAPTTETEKKPDETPSEPQDKLAEVKLPPHAKPETTTAFAEVKRRAREEAAALRTENEALKKKIPTDGSAITPELKKEMDDLRAFRAAHDYQSSPEFVKSYVEPVAANEEAILKKLKTEGFTDEQIGQIKAIGVAKLDWVPIFAKLPPTAQRIIEGKLIENETILDKKAAAVAAGEKAPIEFAAKQKLEKETATKAEEEAYKKEIDGFFSKIVWSQPKTVPADATAAQRTEIEGFNKFVKDQADRRAVLETDRSPQMRATLVTSTLMAYDYKARFENVDARLKEAEAELAQIKKSSSTARRNSNAPSASVSTEKRLSATASGKDAFAAFEAENAVRD